MTEGPLPGEGLAPEVEMNIPIASSEATVPIATLDESEEPITEPWSRLSVSLF